MALCTRSTFDCWANHVTAWTPLSRCPFPSCSRGCSIRWSPSPGAFTARQAVVQGFAALGAESPGCSSVLGASLALLRCSPGWATVSPAQSQDLALSGPLKSPGLSLGSGKSQVLGCAAPSEGPPTTCWPSQVQQGDKGDAVTTWGCHASPESTPRAQLKHSTTVTRLFPKEGILPREVFLRGADQCQSLPQPRHSGASLQLLTALPSLATGPTKPDAPTARGPTRPRPIPIPRQVTDVSARGCQGLPPLLPPCPATCLGRWDKPWLPGPALPLPLALPALGAAFCLVGNPPATSPPPQPFCVHSAAWAPLIG